MELHIYKIFNILLVLDTILAENNLIRKLKSIAAKNSQIYQVRVGTKRVYKTLNSLEELMDNGNYLYDIQNLSSVSLYSTTPENTSTKENSLEDSSDTYDTIPASAKILNLLQTTNSYNEAQHKTDADWDILESRLYENTNLKYSPFSVKESANLSEEYPKAPPWVQYKPMRLRDESGSLINLNNTLLGSTNWTLPNETAIHIFGFKFPQARKRWWWERGIHHMHWLFWHCQHWIMFWNVEPPSNAALRDNEELLFDENYYINYKEAFYDTYCNWLVPKDKRLKFVRKIVKIKKPIKPIKKRRKVTKPTTTEYTISFSQPEIKEYIASNYDYHAVSCYHCNKRNSVTGTDHTINGELSNEICTQAFTQPMYDSYKYYMKAMCFQDKIDSPYKQKYKQGFFKEGKGVSYYMLIRGQFANASCITISSDMGESYAERSCRSTRLSDIRGVYPFVEQVGDQLSEDTQYIDEGCYTTPFAQYFPLMRSKAGLYLKITVCFCKGNFCNSSCRLTDSILLLLSLLFLKVLVL